jgi:hypothetical protein
VEHQNSKGSGKRTQIKFQCIGVKEQEIICSQTKSSSFAKDFFENERNGYHFDTTLLFFNSFGMKVYSSIRSKSQNLNIRLNMMCLSIRNFILEVEKLQLRTRFEPLRLVGAVGPLWLWSGQSPKMDQKFYTECFLGSLLTWQLTNNQKMSCDSGRAYDSIFYRTCCHYYLNHRYISHFSIKFRSVNNELW